MLRKLWVVVILFSTSSCVTLTSPASPLSTPTLVPAPIELVSPIATPADSRQHAAVIQRAMTDLAQRLGIESTLIRLESIIADEFPGGDLGCPQPDRPPLAQPAIITGQRIVLRAGSIDHEYRAAGTQLVYCGPR